MNIKRRLQISNLLMIAVPAGVALVVGIALILGAWTVLTGGGLGRSDLEEFGYEATAAAELAGNVATGGMGGEAASKQAQLEKLLAANGLSAEVLDGSAPIASYGDATTGANDTRLDSSLATAAAALTAPVNITSGTRALAVRSITSRGRALTVRITGSVAFGSKEASKAMLVAAGAVLVGALAAAVIAANRFLTRFVLRHVTGPLDALAAGAEAVATGDLTVRLATQDLPDEFTPAYRAFNDMVERMAKTTEREQRLNDERRDLVMGLSHDLKSPLTSIKAYAEGLIDGIAATPEAEQRYLTTIRDKAELMRGQIDKISLVYRLDRELGEASLAVRDMGEIVERWCARNRESYRLLGVELACNATPAPALTDAELMDRVLANLLDNCVKYARAGRACCRVDVTVDAAAVGTRVTVRDDGPGVGADELNRIFDLFFRGDAARSDPEAGSGVGLATVARALELMGGSAHAEAPAEGGLAVVLAFAPVAPGTTIVPMGTDDASTEDRSALDASGPDESIGIAGSNASDKPAPNAPGPSTTPTFGAPDTPAAPTHTELKPIASGKPASPSSASPGPANPSSPSPKPAPTQEV